MSKIRSKNLYFIKLLSFFLLYLLAIESKKKLDHHFLDKKPKTKYIFNSNARLLNKLPSTSFQTQLKKEPISNIFQPIKANPRLLRDVYIAETYCPITIKNKKGFDTKIQIPISSQFLTEIPLSQILEEEKTYTLKNEIVKYIISENYSFNEFLAIEISGIASLSIKLYDDSERLIDEKLFTLENLSFRSYIIFDFSKHPNKFSHTIILQNMELSKEISFWTCTITKMNSFETYFDYPVKFYTYFTNSVLLKVHSINDQLISTNLSKFQFLLQTSYEHQIHTGSEKAYLAINYNIETFPLQGQGELKAYGSLKAGLIKSISRKNLYFCQKKDCFYYVSIFLENIDFVYFFPKLIFDKTIQKFMNKLSFLDELEKDDFNTHEIISELNSSYLFLTLISLGNKSKCLINIGIKPINDDQYEYSLDSQTQNQLFISKGQISEKNKKVGVKIYIKFKDCSSDLCLSQMNIIYGNEFNPLLNNLNSIIKIAAKEKELISFSIDLNKFFETSVKFWFKIFSRNDCAKVLLKECQTGIENCQISANDFEKVNEKDDNLSKKVLKFYNYQNPKTVKTHVFCSTKNQTHIEEVSSSCQFVIGILVDCLNVSGDKESFNLELKSSMKDTHTKLFDRMTNKIKAIANEEFYYKFKIDQENNLFDKQVDFYFYIDSGFGFVYISGENEFPSASLNEKMIELKSSVNIYPKSRVLKISILKTAEQISKNPNIYLFFTFLKDSRIDVVAFISEHRSIELMTDIISSNSSYWRFLSGKEVFIDLNGNPVFYKNFRLKISKEEFLKMNENMMQIVVNSNVFGLGICVYFSSKNVQMTNFCDLLSNSQNLKIYLKNYSEKEEIDFLISIQKRVKYDVELFFPIEFRLDLSDGINLMVFKDLRPGMTFSSLVESNFPVELHFDFSEMAKKGVMFYSSNDQTMSIEITIENYNERKKIAVLSAENFGLEITNVEKFKTNFCFGKCIFSAKISTLFSNPSIFHFTIKIDDLAIVFREGDQLDFPNSQLSYFIYQTVSNNAINFVLNSFNQSSNVFSGLSKTENIESIDDISQIVSENIFDYKHEEKKSMEINYTSNQLNSDEYQFIAFMINPKINAKKDDQFWTGFRIIEESEIAKAYIQTNILELSPNQSFSDRVLIGGFRYYSISFQELSDFTISMSNIIGECILSIEKGAFNFPTMSKFWKKSTYLDGNTISIKQNEYKDQINEFIFTIAVYGVENTNFSIFFTPETKNVIHIEYQKLTEITIKPNKNYYFNFNKNQESLKTIIYAMDSDLLIDIFIYDSLLQHNMIEKLDNEKFCSGKVVLRKDDIPLTDIGLDKSDKKVNVYIKTRSFDHKTALISVLLYNESQPVLVLAESRIQFVLKEKSSIIFEVKLASQYKELSIDVKLHFGSVLIYLSEDLLGLKTAEIKELHGTNQLYMNFFPKLLQSNFYTSQVIFVKIDSFEVSRFSLFVKPLNKFKKLQTAESEIIFADKNLDTFVYFPLYQSIMKSTKALQIELDFSTRFIGVPELLFLGAGELSLSPKSTFLSMPINSISEKQKYDNRQLMVDVVLQIGYYVIKIPKNEKQEPIKINIVKNYENILEPNGFYIGRLRLNGEINDIFSVYFYEPGVFRITLENCGEMSLTEMSFSSEMVDRSYFDANMTLNSVYKYPIFFNNELLQTEKEENILFPQKKFDVKKPGLINFKLTNIKFDNKTNISKINSTKDYFDEYRLISEFKPFSKNFYLKEYIETFDEHAVKNDQLVKSEFILSNRILKVMIKKPNLKSELYLDFPNFKMIKMNIFVYFLNDFMINSTKNECGRPNWQLENAIKKTIQQEYLRNDENIKKEEFFEINFSNEDLKIYKNSSILNVYSEMSLQLIENAMDEYDVILSPRYIIMPYFLLKIKNEANYSFFPTINNFFIFFFFFLFFGLVLLLIFYKIRSIKRNQFQQIENQKKIDNLSESVSNNSQINDFVEFQEKNNTPDETIDEFEILN